MENNIINLLEKVIGEYTPVVDTNNNIIGGVASFDIPWIMMSLFLMLFTYCLFRLIGGLFK